MENRANLCSPLAISPFPGSARRQDHHHLAPLHPGLRLDLGHLGGVLLDPVQQPGAELLVGHLAAAEAERDLDLVAFLEEALHRPHLHLIVVVVDHRPELDLLDLDDLLLLAGLGLLFLLLEPVFPVVQDLADRRHGVGRNLDQIETGLRGLAQCVCDGDGSEVGTVLVDQVNLANANVFIDALAVLLDGRLRSLRATNGGELLVVSGALRIGIVRS